VLLLLIFRPCAIHAGEQVKGNIAEPPARELPLASDSLVAFFEAAKDLDRQLRDATLLYRSAVESFSGKTMTADTERIILELISQTPDAREIANLIPPGLPPAIEAGVLRIWATLASRISGLKGSLHHAEIAARGQPMVVRKHCFGSALSAQDRFDDKITRAAALADSQPWSVAAPDSVAAAELAIRLELIWKVNNCCDSCGGEVYEKPIAVDWENHMAGGVGFDATFTGKIWLIDLHAG